MSKAVIMAGGFGTRLRPLTINIPKPMVPIMNVPMMEHIVNLLKNNGITDIVSVLYFHPEKISSYFENGSKFGVDMKYVMANADYGTAGAVRNAYEQIKGERIIVISGDVLTDFDLSKAIAYHEEKKSLATILLTRVENPLQYGIVMTDEAGKITRFLEKPSWGQVFSDTINTGMYILEPEVLDMIPYREEFDFSKDLFPLMLQKKMNLMGYIAEGYWRDIGNLNEYQRGQIDAIRKAVKLDVRGTTGDSHLTVGYNGEVAKTAKFHGNVLIGNNCKIGEHSELSDCVIGDGCEIGDGVVLSGVTIWNDTKVKNLVQMNDDVVCANCVIDEDATVSENVFISDNCVIGKKALLKPNIKLWPNKRVEDGATVTGSLVQEEKWMRELFFDARITGIANVDIHPNFCAKLGSALGMAFGPNTMMLASRDSDPVSRVMKRAITSGLASVGVEIVDLQVTSIPQTRQEMRSGKYVAGLHVRRNPRNLNNTDIIIFNKEGRDISINQTKSIERYFYGEDIKRVPHDQVGDLHYPERTNEIYVNRIIEHLDKDNLKKANFKILMDYSYGLASTIMPCVLGKIGVEAISLHNFIDSNRYQGDPAMLLPENDEVPKIMKSMGYEHGFMIDPGAEKISVIDERGMWYLPTRLLTLITKLFLLTHSHRAPYKIAISIAASDYIEEMAKTYDVEVLRIPNSHSAMMEATRDPDVLFVGGVWGSFIFSEYLFAADGMFSVAQILEMLALSHYSLSKLDESIPRRYQQNIYVDCPWEYKGRVMRHLMEHSEKMQRELVEGVKMHFDTGDSVLVVADKAGSGFTVLAESEHFDTAVQLARKYQSYVISWQLEDK